MSTAYIVLAFLVAFTARSQASFEHGLHGFGAIPMEEHHHEPILAAPVPVVHAAPAVVEAAPVMAAPPPPPPVMPIEVHEHHHHPPAEVHNVVGSFHRESGHMSDTDMLLPFKHRRLAAKAARMRKTMHKKKHAHKKN
ncbi:hypothetical protein Y032_0505g2666 [Ancylostoma ceylanicum]|uniref:Uncharacterized protein n=1 Tax=Ancylostoma ceylanicum TaxID=53326 RepID=A0A016WU17_9BILA|nr:hypothetical protein Y032_0505g2666 [Ancylostoma ceylanicum]